MKRKFIAVVWTALTLVILLILVFFVRSLTGTENVFKERLPVIDSGSRTTGTVIGKEVFHDSEEGDSSRVKYTFTPLSGLEFTGSYFFPWTDSNDLNIGDHLEIAYDPQNPTMNLPVIGREEEGTLRGFSRFGVGVLSFILCALTLFFATKAWVAWWLSK